MNTSPNRQTGFQVVINGHGGEPGPGPKPGSSRSRVLSVDEALKYSPITSSSSFGLSWSLGSPWRRSCSNVACRLVSNSSACREELTDAFYNYFRAPMVAAVTGIRPQSYKRARQRFFSYEICGRSSTSIFGGKQYYGSVSLSKSLRLWSK